MPHVAVGADVTRVGIARADDDNWGNGRGFAAVAATGRIPVASSHSSGTGFGYALRRTCERVSSDKCS